MSEANVPPRQLDSKSPDSAHSQMCSSHESAYQALYTEFLAKSRHNNIPNSPVARASLRALIDQTRSDLQTCSETITRSQILRVLELQESLLAPIRTLPSDVLTEIFQLVLETFGRRGIRYTSWESPKLSGRIFVLTWICFWWRDEAIPNPTFWSSIAVAFNSSHASPTTEVTAFLNECILRSGVSVPMNITISISSKRDDSPPALIALLVAQAHRWRQVALSFFSYSLYLIDIMFPFKPSSTHFPFLEDLRCYYLGDLGIDPVQNPILECHPPLRKLELSVLLESYADVIASQNLKILEVGYIGVSLARLLHMCPCLESLTLQYFEFRGNADAKQITCQSSLLTLNVGSGNMDIDDKVKNGAWTGVTLPKLTKLSVILPGLIDDENWEAAYDADTSLSELKEVIKRSKCPLQHVNLIMDADDYEQPLQLTLQTAIKFFEGLPVQAEGSFVEDTLLQEWKEDTARKISSESDSP
ncbi:hypothetical protein BDP27DRAFT_1326543 [Rhodocollybia butyracea]|uniref:F-box domain-containing protein n=1 Tax=Rhodocollybia butyracea TaxID=206335 RepID=A0A9P5PMQ6_9AGAR|nr:hypothetical protein BDP27DRAFT_1326543 [Rhodocollybia butyracea]